MAYELQRNFSAGELTPKMQLRNDAGNAYFNSVTLLRNMIPEPWGPATSRRGFEHIERVPDAVFGRLFDFNVDFATSHVVVVTNNTVFVVDKLGFSLEGNVVQNPNFAFGSDDWDERNNVTYAGGLARLRPNPGNLASIRQPVGVVQVTPYRCKIQTLSVDPVRIIGSAVEGGNEIFEEVHNGPEIQFDFTTSSSPFWLEIIADAGSPDIFVDSVSLQEETNIDATIEFVSPWDDSEIAGLHEDMVPNNKIMYFVTRGHEVWKLTREDDGEWLFEEVLFDFGTNDDPWPNDGPGTITFHDGRMWLGGSVEDPVTLWGSVPQEYENFDFGDPLAQTPGDAMILPLDKHGVIQWLLSNKSLFAGLDTGEHVIFGVSGPLDVDNAQTEQHSSYGSAAIQAMTVNESTVYVNTQGRKVRSMDFDDRNESFASAQISFQAEHITEGVIVDAAYGSAPFGILWFALGDGDLISCCIERDQGTLGWARHSFEGQVIAVTTLKESGRDVPWILILRNDFELSLERYAWEFPIFVDSAKFFAEEIAQQVWPGFDHLAGETVQCFADRAIHPDVLVADDGTITLNYEANSIIAGYGFKSILQTLPKIAQRETGNTFSHFKSWSKIVLSVLEGSRPIVNGEDLAARHPATPMDTGEPLVAEYLESTDVGYDFKGLITVEQDAPVPMSIIGIGGKLSEDAL